MLKLCQSLLGSFAYRPLRDCVQVSLLESHRQELLYKFKVLFSIKISHVDSYFIATCSLFQYHDRLCWFLVTFWAYIQSPIFALCYQRMVYEAKQLRYYLILWCHLLFHVKYATSFDLFFVKFERGHLSNFSPLCDGGTYAVFFLFPEEKVFIYSLLSFFFPTHLPWPTMFIVIELP